jgi:hypothetical protein
LDHSMGAEHVPFLYDDAAAEIRASNSRFLST